jgi:hypothetical protein
LIGDGPPAGIELPSEFAGASKYVASRAVGGTVPKPASGLPKSLRPGDKDKVWASRQSVYKSLKPDEKKEQDAWANRIIMYYGRCPEKFGWKRREEPGGYQCNGGGHVVTDELLQDVVDKDKFGIYASEKRAWDESTWDGPYYETFRGSGIWNKE